MCRLVRPLFPQVVAIGEHTAVLAAYDRTLLENYAGARLAVHVNGPAGVPKGAHGRVPTTEVRAPVQGEGAGPQPAPSGGTMGPTLPPRPKKARSQARALAPAPALALALAASSQHNTWLPHGGRASHLPCARSARSERGAR